MSGEPFELLERIGSGGMGVVWKARHTATGQLFALKLLHDQFASDPAYVARLEREVEVARRIESPNTVEVLGFGRREGVPYMVMRYVEGESLRDRLQRDGKLAWPEGRDIARQVALGLQAAHAAGVVHRDIKPGNILLAPDGTVKIADFGIARAMDLTRLTGSVTVLGTPAYMSPDVEATAASDLYALGCVLYEMLTGQPPFTGETHQAVVIRHLREAPDLAPLPPQARSLVGWLLEKRPERRPPNAGVVAAVLAGTTSGRKPPAGRRPALIFAFGAPAVLLLGAGIVVATVVTGGGSDSRAVEPTAAHVVGIATVSAAAGTTDVLATRPPRMQTATGAPSPTASPSPTPSPGAEAAIPTPRPAESTPQPTADAYTQTPLAPPAKPIIYEVLAISGGVRVAWTYDGPPVTGFMVITDRNEQRLFANARSLVFSGTCLSLRVEAINSGGSSSSDAMSCPPPNTTVVSPTNATQPPEPSTEATAPTSSPFPGTPPPSASPAPHTPVPTASTYIPEPSPYAPSPSSGSPTPSQ